VEPANWRPLHCEALKEFVTKGMSYTDAADAINAKFGTAYSRNATLGRARRMGLSEAERPKPAPTMAETGFQRVLRPRIDEFRPLEFFRRRPVFPRLEGVELRCVEVDPRRLALVDLEEGDCRYPYGGEEEGEVITFCGHPRRRGSSYCTPHFHLTRDPDVPTGQAASIALLRLVEPL
jgi:GcrA cell cycle regulator